MIVRTKFIVFLSMLVFGIFLVAAVPVVADACSEEDGPCYVEDDWDDNGVCEAELCDCEDCEEYGVYGEDWGYYWGYYKWYKFEDGEIMYDLGVEG